MQLTNPAAGGTSGSVASLLHWSGTVDFTGPDDLGVPLTGEGDATVVTPSQTDWDVVIGAGATQPSALPPAGVYLVTFSWFGADYAYVGVPPTVLVPADSLGDSIAGRHAQTVLILDGASSLMVGAGSALEINFTTTVDLWLVKIADAPA